MAILLGDYARSVYTVYAMFISCSSLLVLEQIGIARQASVMTGTAAARGNVEKTLDAQVKSVRRESPRGDTACSAKRFIIFVLISIDGELVISSQKQVQNLFRQWNKMPSNDVVGEAEVRQPQEREERSCSPRYLPKVFHWLVCKVLYV